MLFEVIETFEAVGLGALIASYFGERPALSAAKCNLRRTRLDIPGGWHQDGSFLGHDIATLDVWIRAVDVRASTRRVLTSCPTASTSY